MGYWGVAFLRGFLVGIGSIRLLLVGSCHVVLT